MTPERASEILNAHTADGSYDAVIAAILAACAEERCAALTEAAMIINREVEADEIGSNSRYPHIPYYDLRNAILAERDKE